MARRRNIVYIGAGIAEFRRNQQSIGAFFSMHVLRTEIRSLDESAPARDLGQTPADMVFLSFTDSDLAAMANAWRINAKTLPSLRLASLADLRHPFSVDLYLDSVARHARFLLVRLLGGLDYWRYGVDEVSALARAKGIALAIVPGDHVADERLDEASTVPVERLRRLWGFFQEGGPDNLTACLRLMAAEPDSAVAEPAAVAPFGVDPASSRPGLADAPLALIIFYKSLFLSADTAPMAALADSLRSNGFRVASVWLTSLKDPAAGEGLSAFLRRDPPAVILNTTAFSARGEDGGVLDSADAPVLQVILSGSSRLQWQGSRRGLRAADLAMSVVLPEIDGRIATCAISFKAETERRDALQFTRLAHDPEPSRVDFVARLAAGWARLRATPRHDRRLGLILSDYPARAGRAGYAVGLDTPKSVLAIAEFLCAEGFDVEDMPDPASLMDTLTRGSPKIVFGLDAYARLTEGLPAEFMASVQAAWGDPAADADVRDGAFQFRHVRMGKMVVAVQPDRGRAATRKTEYHDADLAPRHGYVAFYLWLREVEKIHALIHCGAHGTLEWLPGKATALSDACAPEAVLGPMPLIYPFIVNNPGEAAQAKRRTAAVTIGHLTPPLIEAGSHGEAMDLEALFDEFSEAEGLDPRRARLLADAILEKATDTGLLKDSGVKIERDRRAALVKLDAWLCDLKEMRIGDGLHVFGRPAPSDTARDACGEAELAGLLKALDGRFVPPGPAGAPSRGRLDVLPTGRNLFTVDPRAVPTRTAWIIGQRTADELLTRHVQDHGDWPRRIVFDLWGSATMRTGGDEFAQALALLGVRPVWDNSSTRVNGFEILALAQLGRPRVDVTLRISGLFRDVFATQIALFDDAVRAVAALDEPLAENPLVAAGPEGAARIFGGAPGQYGIGLTKKIALGDWETQADLAETYLQATSHAYGANDEGVLADQDFRACVAIADAYVHVQDMPDQDVLNADAFAEHEGGFAAAAAMLGAKPALYHADTTRPDATVVRTLDEEVARVLRGRAVNPRWIAGQMRHGHRGASEIAETIDNVFAFAATTDAVSSHHFDLLFDATCGNDAVRDFLMTANHDAARGIAARFEQAVSRGFWRARRNSAGPILADMLQETGA